MTMAITSGRHEAGIQCKDLQPAHPPPQPQSLPHPLYLLGGLECAGELYSSGPNLFGTRDQFCGGRFFHRLQGGGVVSG